MAEIDGFVDCVEKGSAPLASFEDGRRALILAEAAYMSMRERRMVKVSEVQG
jgi:myo-inositol 2-dehydrogenase/D-chiro-inositol 1-dehydrogenase